MFITKKHISRRAVLRGGGAVLALPLLDAMIPASTALAQTAATPKHMLIKPLMSKIHHDLNRGLVSKEWRISVMPLTSAQTATMSASAARELRGRARIKTPTARASNPRTTSAHQVRRCFRRSALIRSASSMPAAICVSTFQSALADPKSGLPSKSTTCW